MANLLVTFDTNVYRNIAEREDSLNFIELIKKKERELGIEAMMNSTVAMELINHLKEDEKEETKQKCSKAASVMYVHTGNEDRFNLLPLIELEIANLCFGVVDDIVVGTQNAIGQILYGIKNDPSKALVTFSEQIKQIQNFLGDGKVTYEEVMYNYFKNVHDLIYSKKDDKVVRRKKIESLYDSDEFAIDTVMAMIIIVLGVLYKHGKCIVLTKEECVDATVKLLDAYKIPLAFRRKIFKGKLEKDSNPEKVKLNNQLDEYILFCVDKKREGRDTLLVTDDNRMINAAKEVNPNCLIKTLEEYEEYLGLKTE